MPGWPIPEPLSQHCIEGPELRRLPAETAFWADGMAVGLSQNTHIVDWTSV
ncbi:hypothetical protein PHLCEN_2v9561 [Hermanssonia centrifuga]|uniref:Uncharacterized protein n=1 Tax=Hermanssonia centrifuga TaxID=98765 RepID=A0A2R6NQK9_9APHY|nr:hypothetical protein PHLCEN_2v9561 [Hermanssonia centrifuga]